MQQEAIKSKQGHNATVALIVLMLVSIFNYLDRTIISILQVPIKRDLLLSDAQLGAMTGLAFALFYSTLGVPVARLADRFSRKYVIITSLVLWSGMTALCGFATGFAGLVFFRIGVALGEAGSIPASHSVLADYYPLQRRARAFAVWGLALPIGVMLGYLCGGWLAQAMNWRSAFWIIGGIGVLLAPIIALFLREPPRGSFDHLAAVTAVPWRQGVSMILQRKSLLLFFSRGALNNFVLSMVLNWSAPFYVRAHGMHLQDIATALSLMTGIGGGLGILLGGWLIDRIDPDQPQRRPRLVGWVLMAVTPFAFVQFLVPSTSISLISGGAVVMLLFFYYAPIIALSLSVVPATIRAFTSSILLLTVNLIGLGLVPRITIARSTV